MRLCAICFGVGCWQVDFHIHLESYLRNCNRFLCSRHEAASKDFSKIVCGSLWSLSTVTFTYGNALTELRAGKNNGWALFFNLCIMLLNLWESPGGKGKRLTLLQLGGPEAFLWLLLTSCYRCSGQDELPDLIKGLFMVCGFNELGIFGWQLLL